MFHFTVIHPFGDYKRGDKIKDEAEMKLIADGENARHVIRTADVGSKIVKNDAETQSAT